MPALRHVGSAAPVDFTVRAATAADFEAWRTLRLEALERHPDAFGQAHTSALMIPPDEARRHFVEVSIAPPAAMFVAIDDAGHMLGALGVYRESGPKSAHRAAVWGVYVRPEARGRGVGDRLLEAAIAHAHSLPGVLQIELAVSSHNGVAVALYQRHGFTRYGRHPRALMLDGVPIDEDLMVLMLDTSA